ncbi:MAG TPA: T9SS type A sorting domain-containing protein [Ignavibacteria bacterium]
MKNIILSIIIFFVLNLLGIKISYAQWEPDVRLTMDTNSSETPFNNSSSIAASNNVVHIVWFDNRSGNYEIYYKRSVNAGISWGPDVRLTNDGAESRYPYIALSGQLVHVVWRDKRNAPLDSNYEIYYKKSTDGGTSWGPDIRLTNDPAGCLPPSIAVLGSTLHVVWTDERNRNFDIYYKRSTDDGTNWGPDVRLTNNPSFSMLPSVTVSTSALHIVWHDNRDGNNEIYYLRSTDGGSSWDTASRLTNSPWESRYASISSSGQDCHLVWNDLRTGSWEVFYKCSTDDGISWSADTLLSGGPQFSEFPTILSSDQILHVVWFDIRDNNWEIYYKPSYYGGTFWEEDTRLTYGAGISWFPSVAVSGPILHVVWSDERSGNYEIYYKRDSTGNLVGKNNANTVLPKEFKLGQNYPNPFNPVTHFEFQISKSGFVSIIIYDELGREVTVLLNREVSPGTYETEWDASNYSSGVYYYKLIAKDFSETKKMVLIK